MFALLYDLQTFSRLATIFILVIYIGTLLISIANKKVIIRFKNYNKIILFLIFGIVLLLIPKLIRSSGFTTSELQEFTNIKNRWIYKRSFFHIIYICYWTV